MKESVFNKQWMLNSKDELCGIECGYDISGEHEQGLPGIRRAFGIPTQFEANADNVFGLDARIIRKQPEFTTFQEKNAADKECYGFGFSPNVPSKWLMHVFTGGKKRLEWPGWNTGVDDFMVCWSIDDFFITTTNKAYYETLLDAFKRNDIAIYGKHLTIVIPSKVDSSLRETFIEQDKDAYNLKRALDESKMVEKLEKAKLQCITLQPVWSDDKKQAISFELIPADQKKYKSGKYTIAELDEWIAGAGPVVKPQETPKEPAPSIPFKKSYTL